MRKLHALLVAIAFYLPSAGQLNIDSLVAASRKLPTDTAGIHKLLLMAQEHRYSNLDASMAITKVAEEKATQLGNDTLLSRIFMKLGGINNDMSNSTEASAYLIKARALAEKTNHTELLIKSIGETGTMYYINKQYDKALEFYSKSLALCTRPEFLPIKMVTLGNMGGIFYDLSNQDKTKLSSAINYIRQAFDLAKQLNVIHQQIHQGCNLGLMLTDLGNYDSAAYYLNFAKGLIEDDDYGNLSTYYSNMGRLKKAEHKYSEAIEHYENTIAYGKTYNSPEWVFESYLAISEIYELQGESGKSLDYYKRYTSLRDSVISQDNFAAAADIQNKYEKEKKENEILTLNRDKQIAAAKRKQLTTFLIVALIGTAILGVMLLLLLKNIRARKKAFAELEEKSIRIQQQAVELSQQARLIAKFQSQMNPHFVFNALHNIQGMVISNENKKAISQIQSLAALMRKTFANADKDDIPLEEEINYLKKYVDFESNSFDNKVDFSIDVSPRAENTLIPPMMIQPFIENSIKHAELKKVENPYIKVLIDIEDNLLKIVIRDNGLGLKKNKDNQDMLSHSMAVIRSRIELLFQGKNEVAGVHSLQVMSIPEIKAGTTVKFYLPLNYAY